MVDWGESGDVAGRDAGCPRGDRVESESAMSKSRTDGGVEGTEKARPGDIGGSSNHPSLLDPAPLRRVRFGIRLEVPPPDLAGRVEAFRPIIRDRSIVEEVAIEGLAGPAAMAVLGEPRS